MSEPEIYQEWRITGQPAYYGIIHFPPYDVTLSKYSPKNVLLDRDPEMVAREFMMQQAEEGRESWENGPHLHSRWVIRTEWREENA